jgi:hypothetical protein
MNKTSRETYSRLIGYNFGTNSEGYDRIYNGGYWDPDTNKKQYEFLYYDKDGTLKSSLIVDYKGFREIIDQYDWPRK